MKKKAKEVKKLPASFTDLSVLNRSTRTLSKNTKRHLEEYNKQMALKRHSRMSTLKEEKSSKEPLLEHSELPEVESLKGQAISQQSPQNETEFSRRDIKTFDISKR